MIFKESGKFPIAPYLSKKEYKKCLASFVKYCVDVVFVDEDRNFLLGERRSDKTGAGPWFMGGQIPAFQTLEIQRKKILLRETGLVLADKRFIHLGQMRYWFNRTENGKVPQDALSEIFAIVLTKKEIAKIILDKEEYSSNSLKAYNLGDIKKIKVPLAKLVFLEVWKRYNNQ